MVKPYGLVLLPKLMDGPNGPSRFGLTNINAVYFPSVFSAAQGLCIPQPV